MNNNISLNTLFKQVTITTNKYLENKSYPPKLINSLYLIITAMILKYKDNYITDIYNLLEITTFAIPKDEYSYNKNKNEIPKVSTSFTNFKLCYTVYYNNNISLFQNIELLTYQLNYILFNKQKNTIKTNLNYILNKNTPSKNNILNSVFNIFQSEDIIKIIIEFKDKLSTNNEIKNILKQLPIINTSTYQINNLNIITDIFRPLYQNKQINNIINSNNNEKNLIKELNNILGKNSHRIICNKLEKINSLIHETKNGNYKQLNNLAKECLYLRNDYINRYLAQKAT